MKNQIAEIKKDLSEGRLLDALAKFQPLDPDSYVYIKQQLKLVRDRYVQGTISSEAYNVACLEITGKIIKLLNQLSDESNINANQEQEEGLATTNGQETNFPIITSKSDKIESSMDGATDRSDVLQELLIISLRLEYFDWSQRDYLGTLGELLQQVDHHLGVLPSSKSAHKSYQDIDDLVHSVHTQNSQTRSFLFKMLNSNAEDLMIQTRNVELPKLALQLETLVGQLKQ